MENSIAKFEIIGELQEFGERAFIHKVKERRPDITLRSFGLRSIVGTEPVPELRMAMDPEEWSIPHAFDRFARLSRIFTHI